MFSPILGLSNDNSSFWDSINSPLISDVFSSFKDALKLSRTLFSILGGLAREGLLRLAHLAPRSQLKLVKPYFHLRSG